MILSSRCETPLDLDDERSTIRGGSTSWRRGLVTTLLLATACSAAEEKTCPTKTISETEEAALREPVLGRDNEPFRWREASFEESLDPSALGQTTLPKRYRDDDPFVLRMQSWVDRIDATIRRDFEAKRGTTLIAPKPRIALLDFSPPNAAVLAVPIALRPAAPGRPLWVSQEGLDVGAYPAIRPFLPPSPSWSVPAAVAFLNANTRDATVAEEGGEVRSSCPSRAAADAVGFIALSDKILVTNGLLRGSTEASFVFTIAHELAHYFRAHRTPSLVGFDFWYERDADPRVWPTPSPRQDELQNAYDVAMGKPGAKAAPDDLVARMRANEIGAYSVEEEADRFATMMLPALGFSPTAAFEDLFEQIQESEWGLVPPPLRLDACRALLAKGFVDESGAPVFNTPAPDVYRHTRLCHRLMLTSRLETAIGAQPSPRDPADDAAWNKLKSRAW